MSFTTRVSFMKKRWPIRYYINFRPYHIDVLASRRFNLTCQSKGFLKSFCAAAADPISYNWLIRGIIAGRLLYCNVWSFLIGLPGVSHLTKKILFLLQVFNFFSMTRFCSELAHAFPLLFLNWKCLLFVFPCSDNDCLGLEENFSNLFPCVTNLLFRAPVNHFPLRSPGNSVFVRQLFPYPAPRRDDFVTFWSISRSGISDSVGSFNPLFC